MSKQPGKILMRKEVIRANGLLLFAAVIWGGGFVAQRLGMDSLGPFVFNGFRFLLGALTLTPLLFRKNKLDGDGNPENWGKTLLVGLGAGIFIFGGATFQQIGLIFTTAGKAGFVTGLYVVFVPILGTLWGDHSPFETWLGAGLAAVGLYFLSVNQQLQLAPGDGYVLLGALFWAGHVQFIANIARNSDPIRISFVQSVVTAVLSFLVGFLIEETTWDMVQGAILPILYGGVISIGIAYTLQIVAQKTARPAQVVILLSMEAVFAVLWGWIFLGETLGERSIIGAALMLTGMILSQIRIPGRLNP